MQKYNDNNAKEQEVFKIIKALLLGTAFGLAVCAALLSLTAIGLVKAGNLPIDALPIITVAIGAIGSFFAGYMTITGYKKRGLMLGCAAGFLMFLIIFVTGVAKNADSGVVNAVTKCVIFTVCGGIGGVIKVNRKKKG